MSTRNACIDALRGAAISSVLLLHFTLAYGLKDSPLGDVLPPWLLRGISLNGNYGVTVFFVVSGFLITSTSLQRWGRLRDIDVRMFYALRAARILPPLVLALALIVALGLLGVPFFTNTDNHQHLPASGIACVCVAAIVVGPLFRAAHVDDEIFFMYAYAACFDAIAIGVLSALALQRTTLGAPVASALRWVGAAALLGLVLRGIRGHEVFGFTCVALATAACVCGAAGTPTMRPTALRLTRPLRWLGRHSYELYLFHIIVLALMRNLVSRDALTHQTRLLSLAAYVALSVAVAGLVASGVSKPANAALRRRMAARHRG